MRRKRKGTARGLTWLILLAGVLFLVVPAGAYFIEIDPVGDKGVGDKFTITASTDLPAGEEVLVGVYATSFTPTQKSQSGEFSGASGSTVVTFGGGQLNRISFDVDTSTFRPDLYMVSMEAITQGTTSNVRFRVTEKVLVDYFITLDPIGDRHVGDWFTITGTTTLAPGTEVLFTISSPSFSITRTGIVTSGAGGGNRVDLSLGTSGFPADTYTVNARAVTGSASTTILFRLLQWPTPWTTVVPTTTISDGPGIPIDILLAGGIVGAIAGGGYVVKKWLEGRRVVRSPPAPRLEVQRGMEMEGMDLEKAGLHLEVEGGIETEDETMGWGGEG